MGCCHTRILAGNSAQFTQGSLLPLLRPTGDRSSLPSWTSGCLFLLPCGYQPASPIPRARWDRCSPLPQARARAHFSTSTRGPPSRRVTSECSPLFQLLRRRRSNRMSERLAMMLSLSAVLKNFHFDEIQLVNSKKESYL